MYQYSYQYKDLLDGSLKKLVCASEFKLTLDELFLQPFIRYIERTLSEPVSYEGKDECFPLKISELRGDSVIHFQKMEFKLIDGKENLKKSLGFGRKS